MAKTDKSIAEEALIEKAPALIQELVAAQAKESFEERDARLKREDYQRRNLQAMDEYEKITGQPHPSRHDPDAAVNQRCCF